MTRTREIVALITHLCTQARAPLGSRVGSRGLGGLVCGLCGVEMRRFAVRCERCEKALPGWPGVGLLGSPACVRFLRGSSRVRAGRPRGALACAARRHHVLSDALARVSGLLFTVRYRSCGRPDDQSSAILQDLVALEDHVRRQTDAAAAEVARVLFAATPGLQRDSRGRCLVVEHDGSRSAHFSVDVNLKGEYAPLRVRGCP